MVPDLCVKGMWEIQMTVTVEFCIITREAENRAHSFFTHHSFDRLQTMWNINKSVELNPTARRKHVTKTGAKRIDEKRKRK